MVNGQILVEDGALVHVDPGLLMEAHNRAARKLLVRAALA